MDKETRNPWNNRVDLLINILLQEEMLDAAWATARQHRASPSVMEALAQASEASHPAEALLICAERVEELASSGGNRAYAEAAKFIIRMAALRSAAAQAAYVADIKVRFGRKRCGAPR